MQNGYQILFYEKLHSVEQMREKFLVPLKANIDSSFLKKILNEYSDLQLSDAFKSYSGNTTHRQTKRSIHEFMVGKQNSTTDRNHRAC